jgi:GNAT superfamily N-acetyltransferase
MLPGKAKRARSVNALFPGQLPLDEKTVYCERRFAAAGLPVLFRITPFVQPADLDEHLARRGYKRYEDTAVESAPIAAGRNCGEGPARPMDLAAWVEAVGELRGSPPAQRHAHRTRLEGTPLVLCPMAIEEGGRAIATGLVIVEDDCAGIFDVVTLEAARRRGHARALVASLLAAARGLGAHHAYLQVEAGNAPARRLYREFGFEQRYVYWYRGRDA